MRSDELLLTPVGGTGLWAKPLSGALDETNARYLIEAILDEVRRTGRVCVYLDLKRVEAVDEFILTRLVVLTFRLAGAGGRLFTFQVRPIVYAAIRSHGLTGLLRARRDLPDPPFRDAACRGSRRLAKSRMR